MRPHRLVPRLAFAVASLLSVGLLACGTYPSQNQTPPVMSLRLTGGNGQAGTVGTMLPERLAVQVLRGSAPAVGVPVVWRLAGELDRITTTDGRGVASAFWTLPTWAGSVSGTASIDEAALTVNFNARANPGPAVALTGPPEYYAYVADQVGLIGAPLTMDYMAAVADSYGNPLPDYEVDWAVTAGGGSVQTGTPYYGYHQARHTLGTTPEPQTVIATAPDLPGRPSFTFRATGVHALVPVLDHEFKTVIVHVGETVGWQWGTTFDYDYDYGPSEHDVIFEDAPSAPASASVRGVGVHTRTFHEVGIYRYRCTLHSTDFEHGHVGLIGVVP